MIKDLINAVASERSLSRSLGISGIHFTTEIHLTKHNIEYLKANTTYLNIPRHDEDNITFMNCPVIEDTTNFVCTVHKINLVER